MSRVNPTPVMFNVFRHCLITLCLFTIIVPAVRAEQDTTEFLFSHFPDRRKEQFQTSPGYALFPFPYSLPGIGEGLSLVGASMNMNNTHTDAYGLVFTGDVEGLAIGTTDVHILPRTLIFDAGYSTVSKAVIQSYSKRGMETDKNDFRLLELEETEFYGGRLTATFFKRRLEIYGAWYEGGGRLGSIRDKDGNIIIESQDASVEKSQTTLIGGRIDLTDDYSDPRQGFRLDITRLASPASDSGPDFYVIDYNMTVYVPIGKRSTWAFNFLRSDAVVNRQGETDPTKLQDQNGINCNNPLLSPQQQQFCIEVINNTIANNTYGTATSLGGFGRLRSYSQGRYVGAHTQFFGSEFRWNVNEDSKPFDIFVMKDIRTSVQLAAFFEIGSTADQRSEVGDTWRESYGFGIRMVTASGIVFRADMAFGHEGFAPQIFIGYPWEI